MKKQEANNKDVEMADGSEEVKVAKVRKHNLFEQRKNGGFFGDEDDNDDYGEEDYGEESSDEV